MPRQRKTNNPALTGTPKTPRDILVHRYKKYAQRYKRPSTIRRWMQCDCIEFYQARRSALGITAPDGSLDPLPEHQYRGAIHSPAAVRQRAEQGVTEWHMLDYFKTKPGRPYNDYSG